MRDIKCEELNPALTEYMNGRYGKIDKVFFQQIGQKIKGQGFLTAVDLFCVICWKTWSYEEAIELADKGKIAKAIVKLTEYPTKLYGVGVRTASAILTFYNPNKYPVVDIHSWRALYEKRLPQGGPTPEEYEKYLEDVKSIAKKCKLTAHEVDAALWVIGRGKP